VRRAEERQTAGVLRRNCDPRRASGAARAKTTDEDARYAGKRRENDETGMKEYKEYSQDDETGMKEYKEYS